MNAEQRNIDQERDIRLKTMLVMTGMDHLIDAMDEHRQALEHAQGTSTVMSELSLESDSSGDILQLFERLLAKFNAIDEKLRSIQTAHFALQHSCSSATEVAEVALKNYQRGNPYLTKIGDILTQHSELDTTEAIINSATDMISVARRDTEHFLASLQNVRLDTHQHQHSPDLMPAAALVRNTAHDTHSAHHFSDNLAQGL